MNSHAMDTSEEVFGANMKLIKKEKSRPRHWFLEAATLRFGGPLPHTSRGMASWKPWHSSLEENLKTCMSLPEAATLTLQSRDVPRNKV